MKKYANFIALLFAPMVHVISLLTLKDKRRWCFGAWFGEKYADNSKYLYEEALRGDAVKAIWITKNIDILNKLRNANFPAFYCYSIMGLWHQLRAGVFICTVNSKDFYFACVTRRSVFVQLWHGLPFKKIGFDVEQNKIKKLKDWIRGQVFDHYSFVLCPSTYFTGKFCSAFRVNSKKIISSGYPRNDGLFDGMKRREEIRKSLNIPESKRFFMYLPTHRDEGRSADVVASVLRNLKMALEKEGEDGFIVLVKPHFYDLHFFESDGSNGQLVRTLKDFCGFDLYEVLGASDGLITDYSSIFLDYEILERPIYFICPDLNEYKNKGRGLYFNSDTFAKVICFDVDSLLQDIRNGENHLRDISINDDKKGEYSKKLLSELKKCIWDMKEEV